MKTKKNYFYSKFKSYYRYNFHKNLGIKKQCLCWGVLLGLILGSDS